MLDPAPAATLPETAWSQIAWFTPNETEAEFYLGGKYAPEEGGRRLLERGARGVALKRGPAGTYIATAAGESAEVRAFAVEPVDTVAAGDCFNGALAVALLEGKPLAYAARFACAAAALSVTRCGAQSAMPARPEVDALLCSGTEQA